MLTISQDWYLIINAHGGPTSAISQVPMDATSYAHRNALLKYEFYDRVDSGSYPSNGFSFLNGWVQSALNASLSPPSPSRSDSISTNSEKQKLGKFTDE